MLRSVLRCEKITFKNPNDEFRKYLLKAGGVSYVRKLQLTLSCLCAVRRSIIGHAADTSIVEQVTWALIVVHVDGVEP